MFKKRLKIFELLGFSVYIDWSWLILGAVVVWTLSQGFFPSSCPDLSGWTYLLMGLAGAAGLFFSLVFHELSHSLFARKYGVDMSGITLFIFGGVAEMSEEPKTPKAEFVMGLMGPAASAFLAAFFAVFIIILGRFMPVPLTGVAEYLRDLNLVLCIFNLIPAFPLDGGRLLRAGLWKMKGDIFWATRIASRIGYAFGWALILFGAFLFFSLEFFAGIWILAAGWFLTRVAKASYENLVIKEALTGLKVSFFLREEEGVPSGATLQEFLEKFVYRQFYKLFPVIEDGKLCGCVDLESVRKIQTEKRAFTSVNEIKKSCSPVNTIQSGAEALDAVRRMGRKEDGRLLVVEDGWLKGAVNMKDIFCYIAAKREIEGY